MTGSLIETPTLGDRTIADDRTRHHAPRARMDGWWPAAARIVPLFSQPPNARRAAEDCLDETAVLMDRSPDPRRPAPQLEACQDRQNTDDDPNFLYPSEARIARETQGIGEERDSGNECANADQGRCGRPGHRNKPSIRSPDPPLQERGRDRQAEG